jgi:hypothetical protein
MEYDRTIHDQTHHLMLTPSEAAQMILKSAIGDGADYIASLPKQAHIKSKSGENLI